MADSNEEILLKLKIQTDKANAALKKTEVEIKKTIQSFRGLEKGSLDYQAAQAKLAKQQATLAQQTVKYNNALKIQTSAQSSAVKQTKQLRSASGGATASVMEMGRVISDAPYGIRGMANNLTQLVSQMGFTIKSAGSLKLALKEMWAAMMGSLGRVLAITTVISALDFFAGCTKKAKQESNALSKTFGENSTKLMVLKSALDDSNISLEDKNELVKKANEEFEDLNIKIDENGRLTDESAKAIDRLSLSFIKNAKAKAIAGLIQEEMAAQAKLSVENIGTQIGYLEGFSLAAMAAFSGGQKAFSAFLKKDSDDRAEVMDESRERIERYVSMLKKNGGELAKELFGDSKGTGKNKDKKLSPFKTPKELEIDVKNADNAIIQYERKIEESRLKKELNDKLSEATSEEEKRKIREEYQLKRLQSQLNAEKKMLELKLSTEKAVVNTKRNNHIDDLKRATELYLLKLKHEEKLGNITSKERDELSQMAKSQLQIATNQANTEADSAITEIKDKYQTLFGFFEQLGIARKDALTSGFGAKKDDDNEEKGPIEKMKEKLEGLALTTSRYMEVASGLTSFLDGEFQRQMTIEQNKTNAINNELRERLNNENLSAGERKNIQLKIARNDEELRKKQEKIQKKRFKMQKAANIVMALADTYRNAVTAYGSQLIVGDPTSPARGAIAAKFAIASGLINVAMIARQKFQSSAGAAPSAGALGGGGSGSGTGDRSFNFNLAGASRENQLAQTLQGRFDQPLQAYVVSRDITNQQQLDMDIQNNASFG